MFSGSEMSKEHAETIATLVNSGVYGRYGKFVTLEQIMNLKPIPKLDDEDVAYNVYALQYGGLTILIWDSDDQTNVYFKQW